MIAGMNIQNALFIVSAAVTGIVLQRYLGFIIPQVFLLLAIAECRWWPIYLMLLVPEFFMRFIAWIYMRVMYRAEVHGVEANVPDEGAALLVCNHVSYMDPIILSSTIPRPIRFVMYYKIFNMPGLSWMFKAARAIPIAGKHEDAELMQRAFEEVDKALADGRAGVHLPGRQPDQGRPDRRVQVRPRAHPGTARRCRWCRWRSRACGPASSAARAWCRPTRIPGRLRAHIGVRAEPAIPGETATAELLEMKVRALRGDWA